jgi:hypothetical protein
MQILNLGIIKSINIIFISNNIEMIGIKNENRKEPYENC